MNSLVKEEGTGSIMGGVFDDYLHKSSDRELFEEEPVPLNTFLYDRQFLNIGISLSDQQFDVLRHSTQIYRPAELDMLNIEKVRYVNELYLEWGKGCCAGHERISLLDGRELSFEELCIEYGDGRSFWVYSITKDGQLVPGMAHHPRITKYVDTIVQVVLDNGEVIECTEDHQFMLRDGQYKKAIELSQGESLMPLYRKIDDKYVKGYERSYNPKTDGYQFTHQWVWRGYNNIDKIPTGNVIHHWRGKRNNSPEFLELMIKGIHDALHLARRNLTASQAEYASKCFQDKCDADPIFKEKVRKAQRDGLLRAEGKIALGVKKYWSDPINKEIRRAFYRRPEQYNLLVERAKLGAKTMQERLNGDPKFKKEFLQKIYRPVLSDEHKDKISNSLKEYFQFKKLEVVNHKVVEVNIVSLNVPIPVYDITVEKYHNFALSSGVFVHNSGKDLISMLTAARIAYLLLCLRDPQGYFGMPIFANIDMVNMAYNADQAKFNFYEPMRKLIEKSKCFKNRADCKERHIVFDKNIYAHSGHSDEDAAEGKSLILAVLDEISAFKTKSEFSTTAQRLRAPKYSYEALIDAMKSSRQSRFDTGKLIAISYPRYKGCPIQQLYAAGVKDNQKLGEKSKVYVSFGCTWDINPTKTKDMFEDEFRKNPGLVKAKYMCDPSQAEDSFVKNIDILDITFPDVPEAMIPHTLDDYPTLKPMVKCNHNFACSAHIDLGLNNCRAGFALTHQYDVKFENIINPDNGQMEQIQLPLVGIDIITSFQSSPGKEIDFSEIRKFLFALKGIGYHISVVSYDQWNSAGERQTLEKAGFNVMRRSVDLDKSMYDDVVVMMSEHRLTGGYASYRAYTFAGQTMKVCIVKEEFQNLVELRGKKIDHRPGGSKDETDALVGSVRGAIEFGVWQFGERDTPTGESTDVPLRAVEAAKSESKIVEKMKVMAGVQRVPGELGYRGLPTGR